jgi:hypothetical protein
MSAFRMSAKIVCLSIILFNLSCSIVEHKKQIEEKSIRQLETEEVKETKAEFILSENGELTTKDLTQNRNMSLYAQGGYFDCRGWEPKDELGGECSEKKLKDFIWNCWTSKKRGYVRISYLSVEGVISTSHIFIEPSEEGNWKVFWRIVRSEGLIHDVPELASVERIENKPEKGEWALAFKDKSGKVLERVPDFYE